MFTVFLVIQVIIVLAMVGLILLQRSESDGLSGLGGGGGAGAFMTGRAAANFLTRTTAILATLFMLNSLWLAILASGEGSNKKSLVDQIEAENPAAPMSAAGEAVPAQQEAATPEQPAQEEPEATPPPVSVPTE